MDVLELRHALEEIAASIGKNSKTVGLECEPIELTVTINGNELSESEYTLNGSRLELPPMCDEAQVSYQCPRTI